MRTIFLSDPCEHGVRSMGPGFAGFADLTGQFFTQIFACLKNLAGPQCQDLCIKYGQIFSISPVSANGQNDRDTIFHLLLEFPGIDIFIRKGYFSVLLHWDQGTVPRMM